MGRFRPQQVIRSSAVVLLCALCLYSPAQSQDSVIRVNVRLVRMLVTVKDANGQLIGSLNKNDFTIFDNGVQQEISNFERQTDQPLSVALMVDTSASVGIQWRYEVESVSKFLKGIIVDGESDDTVALYSFNWQVSLIKDFSRRFTELDMRLRQIHPEGGTSLYDGIHFASRGLEDRRGRHVIVVVTDGGDTTSRYDFHHALEAAQRADVVMYPVVVIPITNDAGRNTGGEHALTTLATGTGGRVFTPSIGPELDRAFTDILRELRTQYSIGFYPRDVPPTKDRFHTLKVNVTGRNLRVITRSGYYGESDGSPKSSGR